MVPAIAETAAKMVRAASVQAVVGGSIVAAVAGSLGWTWVCLAALIVSTAGEPSLHRHQTVAISLLRRISLGLTVRVTLRLLSALALVAQSSLTWVQCAVVGLSAFVFVLGRAWYVFMSSRLSALRRSVVESRNFPLDGLDVPPAPPAWLTGWSGSFVSGTELLVTLPACLAVALGGWIGLLAPLGVLAVFAAAGWCAAAARRGRDALSSERVLAVVQQHLDALAPEVVLYFGDSASAVYQADMWLETLERLPQRCLILLRSRGALAALGPTRIPVLCVPSPENLMALDLTRIRVALYVSNIGNNIHLLRVPGIRSSFIGHGDSDKTASFNPYSRVYDEVWVAGPAGRQRYREADVGVRDSQIVEVGRPQLDEVATGPRSGGRPTVLYAPTWEGWGDAQSYSSVAAQGVALAESILRDGTGVRLIYRPHPFLGRRDPVIAAAHRRIVEMIRAANRRAGRPDVPVFEFDAQDPLARLHDPLQRSAASGRVERPVSALEIAELRAAAESAYWSALGPDAHVVMEAGGPSLLSSFAQADVLVTDVSSVLSDFLATGRPYVVCNVTEPSEEAFVAAVPSARAGLVLGPEDDAGMVARLARGEIEDADAELRQQLRHELLGPDSVPAQERFRRAVSALADRPVAEVPEPQVGRPSRVVGAEPLLRG